MTDKDVDTYLSLLVDAAAMEAETTSRFEQASRPIGAPSRIGGRPSVTSCAGSAGAEVRLRLD